MATNLIGQSDDPNTAGVLGESATSGGGSGVYGRDRTPKGNGVIGYSDNGRGVWGHSNQTGDGVLGESANGRGVAGTSQTNYGIRGHSNKIAGIRGSSDESRGVEGWATNSEGVVGISTNGNGVWGQTDGNGIGVLGTSTSGVGVHGKGGRLAGLFEGTVEVTGSLTVSGVNVATLLQRIQQLEQQGANSGQLVQRVSSLEQKVAALESQLNTAVSNLTGRVTQTEFAISDLRAKVQQIIQQLGG